MTRIIQRNLPLLRANIHSNEHQIRSAFRRRDRVSLNHRTAAWLASYFDILFAANRSFNPGEKRLLVQVQALPTAPEEVAADAEAACTGACSFAHLGRLLLRLDQSSAENPVERFRRIELYIRWMEESAAPEAPDSKVATTQLRNLGQNFTPLVSPFLGPGVADSLRF